jgi:hypothetical protein
VSEIPISLSTLRTRCLVKLTPDGSATVNELSLGAFFPATSWNSSEGFPSARPVRVTAWSCGLPPGPPLPPPVNEPQPDTVNGVDADAV